MIVVTADKGLCGSFNTNLIKGAGVFITGSGEACSLGLVGRKGRDFFGRRGFAIGSSTGGQRQTFKRCQRRRVLTHYDAIDRGSGTLGRRRMETWVDDALAAELGLDRAELVASR